MPKQTQITSELVGSSTVFISSFPSDKPPPNVGGPITIHDIIDDFTPIRAKDGGLIGVGTPPNAYTFPGESNCPTSMDVNSCRECSRGMEMIYHSLIENEKAIARLMRKRCVGNSPGYDGGDVVDSKDSSDWARDNLQSLTEEEMDCLDLYARKNPALAEQLKRRYKFANGDEFDLGLLLNSPVLPDGSMPCLPAFLRDDKELQEEWERQGVPYKDKHIWHNFRDRQELIDCYNYYFSRKGAIPWKQYNQRQIDNGRYGGEGPIPIVTPEGTRGIYGEVIPGQEGGYGPPPEKNISFPHPCMPALSPFYDIPTCKTGAVKIVRYHAGCNSLIADNGVGDAISNAINNLIQGLMLYDELQRKCYDLCCKIIPATIPTANAAKGKRINPLCPDMDSPSGCCNPKLCSPSGQNGGMKTVDVIIPDLSSPIPNTLTTKRVRVVVPASVQKIIDGFYGGRGIECASERGIKDTGNDFSPTQNPYRKTSTSRGSGSAQ